MHLLLESKPVKFDKFFSNPSASYLKKILIAAHGWGQERRLSAIVGWSDDVDEKEVEKMLEIADSKVPYELPKIIGPLVAMKNPDSGLLSSIETGAFRPLTRSFLEYGIAREVALSISELLIAADLYAAGDAVTTEAELANAIGRVKGRLDYWELVQLEELGLL